MKKRRAKYYPIMLGSIWVYYALLGIFMQRHGYYQSGALFLSEKASLVYAHQGNLLNILGLTYPSIPFFSILVFRAVNPLWAPILASSLMMSFWVSDLLANLARAGVRPWILVACTLFILANPGFLHMVASGNTGAYIILFFYLMVKHIFLYFRYNTTYYLSMVGIFFTFLVFTDFHYLWFCIFLTPLLLFIALNSLNLKSGATSSQLQTVFNNASLRRKILRRTYAILVIMFLLPVVGFLFFLFLNKLHIGQVWFFEQSPYTTFNHLIISGESAQSGRWLGIFGNDFFIVLVSICILSPLVVVVLIRHANQTNILLTLLSVFTLVEFLAIRYGYGEVGFTQYALLIAVSWVAWYSIPVTRPGPLKWQSLMAACILAGTVTGWIYFSRTPQLEESAFYLAFTRAFSGHQDNGFEEDMAVVRYLKAQTAPGDLVLTDDAVSFPIIALYGHTRRFLLPDENFFGGALENPQLFATYILVSSPESHSGAYDIVDSRYPWLYFSGWNHRLPVFATASYRIYRVNE